MMDKKNFTISLDTCDSEDQSVLDSISFALELFPTLKFEVFASKSCINKALKKDFKDSVSFIECDNTQDRRDSLKKALNSLKNKDSKALVSVSEISLIKDESVKVLPKLSKVVAFASNLPKSSSSFALILDVGAKINPSAQDLVYYALLGSQYFAKYCKKDRCKVGLLGIDKEYIPLTDTIFNAHSALIKDKNIWYEGLIDAEDIFDLNFDVLVTDPVSANIALKSALSVYKKQGSGSGFSRFISKIMKPDWLSPLECNCSLLLGVDGVVVKSYAQKNKNALVMAIVEAIKVLKADAISALKNKSDV